MCTCQKAKVHKEEPSRNERKLLSSESCVSFSEESREKTKPVSKKRRKINARKVHISSGDDSEYLKEHNQHVRPPSFVFLSVNNFYLQEMF